MSSAKTDIVYVVISPVRDEASHIEKTIESIISQTVLPREWIIVDDGSSDRTGEIVTTYTDRYPWIRVVPRHNRGYREPGGGVVAAFYEGYSVVSTTGWEFIAKLDGDLSFGRDYFERCFARFARDSRLGIGGGTVKLSKNGSDMVEYKDDPPFHVRGATKIYRRRCWEEIGPLIEAPGWDTVDEMKANMLGWVTRTFPDIEITHHKSSGSGDGTWRNWYKNGRANYIAGYHPLFMLAKCTKRMFRRPIVLSALGLLAGFASGYLKRLPQVQDRELIRYVRKQQLHRMLLRPSIYG